MQISFSAFRSLTRINWKLIILCFVSALRALFLSLSLYLFGIFIARLIGSKPKSKFKLLVPFPWGKDYWNWLCIDAFSHCNCRVRKSCVRTMRKIIGFNSIIVFKLFDISFSLCFYVVFWSIIDRLADTKWKLIQFFALFSHFSFTFSFSFVHCQGFRNWNRRLLQRPVRVFRVSILRIVLFIRSHFFFFIQFFAIKIRSLCSAHFPLAAFRWIRIQPKSETENVAKSSTTWFLCKRTCTQSTQTRALSLCHTHTHTSMRLKSHSFGVWKTRNRMLNLLAMFALIWFRQTPNHETKANSKE